MRFNIVGMRQDLYIKYDPEEDAVLDAAVKEIDHIDFVSAHRRKTFSLNAEIQVTFAEEADIAALAGLLYQLYSANVPDEPEGDEAVVALGADPYARQSESAPLQRVSAAALWSALSDTDEMNVTKITVRQGAKQFPPQSEEWIIPLTARAVCSTSRRARTSSCWSVGWTSPTAATVGSPSAGYHPTSDAT